MKELAYESVDIEEVADFVREGMLDEEGVVDGAKREARKERRFRRTETDIGETIGKVGQQ